MPPFRPTLCTLVLMLCLAVVPAASAQEDETSPAGIVRKAQDTIADFAADPDLPFFKETVPDAQAVFVVPTLLKGGFFLGGSGGEGALLARQDDGTWSNPAFYAMGSVSFGLQIGAELAEVVLLVMTESGLDSFLATSFQLGGDVSVAAGPVGIGGKARTADIYAFSRSKGLYGGISFEGSVVEPRDTYNSQYYGQDLLPREILLEGAAPGNPNAEALREAIAQLTGSAS